MKFNTIKSITELFEYLHKFDYGFIHNGRKVINPKERDWFNYKTLSIKEMDKYHIGTCWDTTHYTYRYLKSSGFRFVESYYIQNNNCKNTHTFTYYYNSSTHKHCIIECSWYGHYGIHEYNDKDAAINEYFELFKQSYPSNKYIVFKYTHPESSGLTAEQFIGTIYNTGVVFRTLGYNQEDIKNMRTLYGANINTVTEATIPKTKRKKIQSIAEKIHLHVEKTSKPPTGNQNCQLCVWCSEVQIRGVDSLPRPVYSPRDTIFNIKGENIVINPERLYINSINDIINIISEGNNTRFYCHVNWSNSSGGHEILLLNIDCSIYIMDSQKGSVLNINTKEGKSYFKNINYKNSYIVRLDNKEFNYDLLVENNTPSKTLPWDEKRDIEYMKNHYKHNMDILTEATIPKTKRKKMEDLIYRVFDALDPSGVNTARYKKLFQPMSDNQFESFFKNLFSDDNLYLNLDIVEYERDLKLENVEKAAKVLNLPLFEHVMMPFLNDDKVNPIVTKIPVPVGYIHLKPMQQLVSKKNTTSTSIGERSSLTGQVTGKDKNARDSDTENISMITIGAEKSLQELLGPRADDQVALNQMLNAIKTKGYVSQKDIKTELKNKTSLNTVDVFLMGMGFKSDLVTDGLLLNKTVK